MVQLSPNVVVTMDALGTIRGLNHVREPYEGRATRPAELAVEYLRDAADLFGIDADIEAKPSGRGRPDPSADRTVLAVVEQKALLGATTVGFAQFLGGLQVWEAGASVVAQDQPLRVIDARSQYRRGVHVAWLGASRPLKVRSLKPAQVARSLGIDAHRLEFKLTAGSRWWLYRYDPDARHHPESLLPRDQLGRELGPPTLDLPNIDRAVEPGLHYPVIEALFSLWLPGWEQLNWQAFVEPISGSVLRVRAFVACASGRVYLTDPTVQSGNLSMRANAATTAGLDAERRLVTLAGLNAPSGGTQHLRGEFVVIQDTDPPTVAPSTTTSPFDFSYSSPTDDFAAAATYHHSDAAFRLVRDLGFPSFFGGTTFPVPVDHRGRTDINANCQGNATGTGVGRMRYGPCDTGTTVGMGTEGRTVWHEFGHALLWDSVHSPNFGFAHSAGDAMAMIVTDPHTSITGADRFIVFTFCPLSTDRRADRQVGDGWAWDGSRDTNGYPSEEILTTTLFRIYQSLGGDSSRQEAQEFASRYANFLTVRAIGSLATSPVTPTPQPDDFANALMTADRLTTAFESFSGGFLHKVVRWSFEKQGLYQLPGATVPVTVAGAPPPVDVYIDDGRNGEYQFRENFWDTTDIWNRVAADGGTAHQSPVVGVPNFVYVRVKNRGSQTANNLVVRGFRSRPMTGLIWPADWQAMTTAQLPGGNLAAGGVTVVGPFEWTPQVVGHECLLMIASADGDRSNVDAVGGTVTGSIPHWRLVPHDNNIAQRNVAPVRGLGRIEGVASSLAGLGFALANTGRVKVDVRLEVTLSPILVRLGWHAAAEGLKERFTLGPRKELEVRLAVDPGKELTAEILERYRPRVDVTVFFDGTLVGGMTFPIEPAEAKRPSRPRRPRLLKR